MIDPNQFINVARVVIFSKEDCLWCMRTKAFAMLHLNEDEYRVYTAPTQSSAKNLADWLEPITGSRCFPQIFVNGVYIGGYRELCRMF